MSDEEADDIKLTLSLILSNQGLIMTVISCFPNVPRSTFLALSKASDIALSKARRMEQDLREKHGIKQSVS